MKSFQLITVPHKGDIHFSGHAVRKDEPEITLMIQRHLRT